MVFIPKLKHFILHYFIFLIKKITSRVYHKNMIFKCNFNIYKFHLVCKTFSIQHEYTKLSIQNYNVHLNHTYADETLMDKVIFVAFDKVRSFKSNFRYSKSLSTYFFKLVYNSTFEFLYVVYHQCFEYHVLQLMLVSPSIEEGSSFSSVNVLNSSKCLCFNLASISAVCSATSFFFFRSPFATDFFID
ncbi:hypothetical protein AGLY_010796 [Aphis glycines]|uniref:Uncharacterized protein n=1 Tax=Aphis glycines TaxID=307491 RepID=A0A6G0TFW7_APHGL|nr:hypothetical protein AGLY_010796 [Aphis glycines]